MIRASRLLGQAAIAIFALAATAPDAGCQSVLDGELRFAPQYVQYQVHAPA